MELSQSLICRGAFGFSQPRTRKRKKEYENLTVKTLPAKEVASFICFGGKKTLSTALLLTAARSVAKYALMLIKPIGLDFSPYHFRSVCCVK